jgi:hypothetical protein
MNTDMSERDVTTLLERRAAAVSASDPPLEEILRARQPGGHRRLAAILAAAAVAVALAASLTWVLARDRAPSQPTGAPHNVRSGSVTVPDVTGMPQSQAADVIGRLGLNPHSLCPRGTQVCDGAFTVMQTDPLPGSVIPPGTTVDMLVADQAAHTRWTPTATVRPDGTLSLRVYGSGTCPPRAAAITALGEQHVRLRLRTVEGRYGCTADLTVTTTSIALPATVRPDRPVIVDLIGTDGQPAGSILAKPARAR